MPPLLLLLLLLLLLVPLLLPSVLCIVVVAWPNGAPQAGSQLRSAACLWLGCSAATPFKGDTPAGAGLPPLAVAGAPPKAPPELCPLLMPSANPFANSVPGMGGAAFAFLRSLTMSALKALRAVVYSLKLTVATDSTDGVARASSAVPPFVPPAAVPAAVPAAAEWLLLALPLLVVPRTPGRAEAGHGARNGPGRAACKNAAA
jgi:hypothetical protein